MHIAPHAEFHYVFLSQTSLAASKESLLYTFTLLARDSIFNSATCVNPIVLGHKTKDSITNERSYITSINKRENLMTPLKAYS